MAAVTLRNHPYAGRVIPGGRRMLVIGDYILIYRARPSDTRILRLWHGQQDWS